MLNDFPMVRQVPFMGVIWVVNEAMKLGFWNGSPEWCNLGQGQPEVGALEGAPERRRKGWATPPSGSIVPRRKYPAPLKLFCIGLPC